MIPYTDEALRMLSGRLMGRYLAEIASPYLKSDGAMLSMLLTAIADELAEGIERRLTDVREMKLLLEQARNKGFPVPLNLPAGPKDMTLVAVNQCHDELSSMLILVHAEVEGSDLDGAENLNQQIWQYLVDTNRRHQLNI